MVIEKTPRFWDHAWCQVWKGTTSDNGVDGTYWIGSSDCDPKRFTHICPFSPVARLHDLRYGPKPEDWSFVWETYEDGWPGQFWQGVDARIEREDALKTRPPGAWIEEDEDEVDWWRRDHD
jgi:hypothetical protein